MFGSSLPELRTPIPGPQSLALAEQLSQTECPALTARRARRAEGTGAAKDPITWAEAKGANVRDVDGNVLVDLTAGFGAALLGHGHPAVLAALRDQEERCLHALGDVHPSDKKIALLSALTKLAPWPARAILGLSGADAVEAAMKTAHLYTKKPGVIAFEGGYHGLSHGPLAVCGYGEGFRTPFLGQLNEHVRFADFPRGQKDVAASLQSFERCIAELEGRAGAVIVEPIQGRGGMRPAPAGFLSQLSQLAHAHGLLVIVDEIYTGLGRTGSMFFHVTEGCEADLVCLGKALGGGVAISACLGKEEVMRAWGNPGGEAIHTSTFLGNPPACAAALAVLNELARTDAANRARERGSRLRNALNLIPGANVVGVGMLLGVHVGPPEHVLTVWRKLMERGYITLPAGAPACVLGLTPPLCITDAQIDGFAMALAECVGAL